MGARLRASVQQKLKETHAKPAAKLRGIRKKPSSADVRVKKQAKTSRGSQSKPKRGFMLLQSRSGKGKAHTTYTPDDQCLSEGDVLSWGASPSCETLLELMTFKDKDLLKKLQNTGHLPDFKLCPRCAHKLGPAPPANKTCLKDVFGGEGVIAKRCSNPQCKFLTSPLHDVDICQVFKSERGGHRKPLRLQAAALWLAAWGTSLPLSQAITGLS